MSALIMVDLDRVHPVFDGRWHRVRLYEMPRPGDRIATLCGQVQEVEYGADNIPFAPLTCWSCELAYCRAEGIEVLPDHPGLAENPTPRPRRPA